MERSISLTSREIDIELDGVGFISSLLHNIRYGRIPKANIINYLELFKNDYKDSDTVPFLINIETVRKNMVLDLSSSSSSLLSKLNSIDLYIPLIYRLYDSIQAQPAVQINKALIYEWESAFSCSNIKMQRSEIIFDIILCLSTKASLHYRYAMSLLEQTNALDNIPNIAKQCNTAASILKYLSTDLIPNWKSLKDDCNKPKSNVYRHPESYECVCRGLMAQYIASAQACSIYKAISKGTTPPSLISKLCVAVVIQIDRCIKEFGSNEYKHDLLPPDLSANLRFIKFFYLSLARYYQGEDFYGNGETGKSIACLRDSLKFLNIQKTGDCLPELLGSLSGVNDGVDLLKRKVQQRLKYIDEENQIVQLQVTADITSIDFPQSVVVVPISDYVRPCLSESNPAINFEKIEILPTKSNSVFGSIFGSLNLGGNKTTKVNLEDSETRTRSDSDLARELHEKLNSKA